jgi:predicted acylesterase/phospholipase RssA
MKRAIALAGGGPAAGLHIGVLDRLNQANMKFDVWALSCIGAWVGIVYNQSDPGKEVEQTYNFFRNNVFRDDRSYARFPINSVFGPDWGTIQRAMTGFLSNPETYKDLWLPDRIMESFRQTMALCTDPSKWNEGDINHWMLNHVMAPNPFVRFWTSMMFLSHVNGLSRIYYPDSSFMKAIKFDKLYEPGKPHILHNAWNITKQTLELFSNVAKRGKHYKPVTAASLCACSALPFIEGTVDIDGDTYCEGALVDTVNFKDLLEDHHDVDEIWVSRIVDAKQIRAPKNLTDSLGNLCQLFAATVGEDDVKLFIYHVKEENAKKDSKKKWYGTVVEIQVDHNVNFEWSHSNLDQGRKNGYRAADEAYRAYLQQTRGQKNETHDVRVVQAKPLDRKTRRKKHHDDHDDKQAA